MKRQARPRFRVPCLWKVVGRETQMLLLCSQIHGNMSRGHKSKTETVNQAKMSESALAKQKPSGVIRRQLLTVGGHDTGHDDAGHRNTRSCVSKGAEGRKKHWEWTEHRLDLAGWGPDVGHPDSQNRRAASRGEEAEQLTLTNGP